MPDVPTIVVQRSAPTRIVKVVSKGPQGIQGPGGSVSFETLSQLDASDNPAFGYFPTGYVYNDADVSKNGIYTWSGSAWVKSRGLADQVATLTVSGGTENAITATVQAGVDPATTLVSMITPSSTNTGPVTINGKPVRDRSGAELEAGKFASGVLYMLSDVGSEFRVMSYDPAEVNTSRDKAQEWAEKETDSPVESGQFSAKHHAEKADASASSAASFQSAASVSASAALMSQDQARAAAEASGSVAFYDTFSAANAAVASIAANAVIEVGIDETRGGLRTRYRKEGGSLVFKIVVGNLPVFPEAYGAVGNGAQAAGADDTAAVLAAINAANGRPVYLTNKYKVALSIVDQPINLIGPGSLVQPMGQTALSVIRTPGPDIAVEAISDISLSASRILSSQVATRIVPASLSGVVSGDVFVLSSQDNYPWKDEEGHANCFKSTLLRVHSLGLNYSSGISSTPFAYGETVTGQTSGATARVLSTEAGTSGRIFFDSCVGEFVSGENLRVSGVTRAVANGKGYIVPSERLLTAYPTSPILNKMPRILFNFEVGIEASFGDIHAIVGSANRTPAVELRGVHQPNIRSRVKSAWSRAFWLRTCWQGEVDVYVEDLPNDANLSEAAYGYGVDICNASHGVRVRVNGGRCRHGFTTNTTPHSSWATSTAWTRGSPKFIVCTDSVLEGCYGEPFDTHAGAEFTTIKSCKAIGGAGLNRTLTNSAGFKDRGFGSQMLDCIAENFAIGFVSSGQAYTAEFPHETVYDGCIANNFGRAGFFASDATKGFAKLSYTSCRAIGDGTAANTPFYQYGFYYPIAVETYHFDCYAARFNGAPMQFTGGRHVVEGCHFDYEKGGTSSTGIRFTADDDLNINGLSIIYNTSLNVPPAFVRYDGATAKTFNMCGTIVAFNKRGLPAVVNSGAGAATVVDPSRRTNFTSIGQLIYPDASLILDFENSYYSVFGVGAFRTLDDLIAELGGTGSLAASVGSNWATPRRLPTEKFLNASQGTIELQFTASALTLDASYVNLWNGSGISAGGFRLREANGSSNEGRTAVDQRAASGDQGTLQTIFAEKVATGVRRKVLFGYAANSTALIVNNGTIQTDTTVEIGSMPFLTLGAINPAIVSTITVHRLIYRPVRRSNSDLAALSA